MNRDKDLQRLDDRQTAWDLVVIGGGATGVAIALDAVTRGLDVLLVEQADFGKGTSSRSTKLIHGGVRYLEQGNLTLVRDALRERTLLQQVAPLLVHDLPFFIPCDSRWQRLYFWFGLKLYDLLAGRSGFGRSHRIAATAAGQRLPTIRPQRHRGGVIYHDGQFDDTRLLIHMARTAHDHGATLLNYQRVTGLTKTPSGVIAGVQLVDALSGTQRQVATRCVINATGPFSDRVAKFDQADVPPRLAASQGVHIVLPKRFFPGDTALIVPRTSDGRVLFLIPWHQHVLVGTTDTPIDQVTLEPLAQDQEIQFLLDTAAEYLATPPGRGDITSVFTGIRPLVKNDRSARTASLSRDHTVSISPAGLVTIVGGKWTTVRKMAEDCLNQAIRWAGLAAGPCRTRTLPLHAQVPLGDHPAPSAAGVFVSPDEPAKQAMIAADPAAGRSFDALPELRVVDVQWAIRQEMAITLEDVLARRTRWLFLDSRRCLSVAAEVAAVMAAELRHPESWVDQQLNQFAVTVAAYTCRCSSESPLASAASPLNESD